MKSHNRARASPERPTLNVICDTSISLPRDIAVRMWIGAGMWIAANICVCPRGRFPERFFTKFSP